MELARRERFVANVDLKDGEGDHGAIANVEGNVRNASQARAGGNRNATVAFRSVGLPEPAREFLSGGLGRAKGEWRHRQTT